MLVTICFLARRLLRLVPHHKLDHVHRLRAHLPQGREILRVEAVQLLLPSRVRNFDCQHSIRVADGACPFRYLRSAHQRPGQQRSVVATLAMQGVGKDLLECRAGMSHGVEASIVKQRGRSSLFAFRFSPESLSSRPGPPPQRASGETCCFISGRCSTNKSRFLASLVMTTPETNRPSHMEHLDPLRHSITIAPAWFLLPDAGIAILCPC